MIANKEKQEQKISNFFLRLKGLSMGERAVLKRNLGQPFSRADAKAWGAFFKIMPDCSIWEEEPYFIVACGYCYFDKVNGQEMSFIGCLKRMSVDSEGIERKLYTILDIHNFQGGYLTVKIGRLLRMLRQKGYRPDFYLAGWAVWLGHALAWLGLPLSVLLLTVLQIRGEERVLAARCGAAYADYRQRVRRWV